MHNQTLIRACSHHLIPSVPQTTRNLIGTIVKLENTKPSSYTTTTHFKRNQIKKSKLKSIINNHHNVDLKTIPPPSTPPPPPYTTTLHGHRLDS
ncbi:hypothetical protein L1887_11739 [Cichorium endivia]|nr:hypothetical protein L1887_11739 [Cichorium endivia]